MEGDAETRFDLAEKVLAGEMTLEELPGDLPANTCFIIEDYATQVGQGLDIADDEIANKCEAGDLIITADIPLAARVVEKGALALDPRGTMYDKTNIGQILDMRNFMDTLRGSGVETGGPDSFGQRERMRFANELDRFIARR